MNDRGQADPFIEVFALFGVAIILVSTYGVIEGNLVGLHGVPTVVLSFLFGGMALVPAAAKIMRPRMDGDSE